MRVHGILACVLLATACADRATGRESAASLETYEARIVHSSEPGQPPGLGRSLVALFREDTCLWDEELAFTAELAVASPGGNVVVTGHSYGQGRSWLDVVMLAPDGEQTLDERFVRSFGGLHLSPLPSVKSIEFHDNVGRTLIRVHNARLPYRGEEWWIYVGGEPRQVLDPLAQIPDSRELSACVGTLPVDGTPLVLAHWLTYSRFHEDERGICHDIGSTRGASFYLLDEHLLPVWSLQLLADHTVEGDAEATKRLRKGLDTWTAMTATLGEPCFEIRSRKTGHRSRWRVARGGASGNAWVVQAEDR